MKGISAVIATILMLMITIALAGTAYLYITGVFTSRTGVLLSIDTSTRCNSTTGGGIILYVRNDGTTVSGTISIDMTYPNGTYSSSACSIYSINAGGINSTACSRSGPGATSGLYGLRVTGGGSSATGSLYCSS